jgi:hypothetical protein
MANDLMNSIINDLLMPGVDDAKKCFITDISLQPMRYLVKDATGEEKEEEAFIELYSMDSTKAKAHQEAIQKRRLEVNARGARVKLTPSQLEAEQVDLLVSLTVSWNFRRGNGDVIPCTPENARAVYGNNGAAYIREQVEGFIGERSNFAKP